MFRFKGIIMRPNIKTQYLHIQRVHTLSFHIWHDDGSFEPKRVSEFLILITMCTVVLLTGINYYIFCSTQRDVSYQKIVEVLSLH